MIKNFKSDFSKKNLKTIINFGQMPLANGFITRINKNGDLDGTVVEISQQ